MSSQSYSLANIVKTLEEASRGNKVYTHISKYLFAWNFPSNVGPYERYNVIYRDVYELVELYDDVQIKYFNNIEFQVDSKEKIGELFSSLGLFVQLKINKIKIKIKAILLLELKEMLIAHSFQKLGFQFSTLARGFGVQISY